MILEHGVQDDEELAHTGSNSNFGLFASLFESIAESLEDGIVFHSANGGHIESASQGGAPSCNVSWTVMDAALIVHGCDSDECGDLLPIELSEFGQFGDECRGRDGSHARYGSQAVIAIVPVIIGLDEVQDGFLNAFEIFVQGIDDDLQAFTDVLVGASGLAIHFAGTEFDELSPACDEFIEFGLFFMSFGDWARLNVLGKAGNDLSVQSISLGQEADAFGITANLPGVHDGDRMPCGGQVTDQQVLIPPRSFDDD